MKYINTNKINELEINKENCYLVLDFDRTITSSKSTDSWAAATNKEVFGAELDQELYKLYSEYRPIELDYNIDINTKKQKMYKWYVESINLFIKYNLTEEKLNRSVEKSNIIFRKSMKQLLLKADEYNIPVIILSAGVGNVISKILKDSNMLSNNIKIISNFIKFDSNGNMEEYKENDIIHIFNKSMEGHISQELEKDLNSRKYKILVGDIIEDENMVPKEEWENTIKIGILEKGLNNLERFKEHFDIVLTEEDAEEFSIDKEIIKIKD